MGDSLINFAKLSDSEIVDVIKSASEELQKRLGKAVDSPRAGSTGSYEPIDVTPVGSKAAGSDGKVLLEPLSCGYHCKWCKAACTRQRGHVHHSCYEHRHRR